MMSSISYFSTRTSQTSPNRVSADSTVFEGSAVESAIAGHSGWPWHQAQSRASAIGPHQASYYDLRFRRRSSIAVSLDSIVDSKAQYRLTPQSPTDRGRYNRADSRILREAPEKLPSECGVM